MSSSKDMTLFLENLEIFNLQLQHKEELYVQQTMIHISRTIYHTEIWLTSSKIPISHHFRIIFNLNEIWFFLPFTASQKMSLHIKTPCICSIFSYISKSVLHVSVILMHSFRCSMRVTSTTNKRYLVEKKKKVIQINF